MKSEKENKFFIDRNILVTGGSGFIATHLIRQLNTAKSNVITILHDLKRTSPQVPADIVLGDIRDPDLLERILAKYNIEIIYHLAAETIVKTAKEMPRNVFSTNILGTWNILEACRNTNRDIMLVYSSTDKVYGDQRYPVSEISPLLASDIYGGSKLAAEKMVNAYNKTYGLKTVITRSANVYGPGDLNPRIIPNTIKTIINGNHPQIYKIKGDLREYNYVIDVTNAFLLLTRKINRTNGEVYNIGSGDVISQEDLVLKISSLMDEVGFDVPEPIYIEKSKTLKEIPKQCLISRKIRKLGWKPKTELDEGLRRTIEFFKLFYNLKQGL